MTCALIHRMDLGISLAPFGAASAAGLRPAAQAAERLGFASIWIPDHVLWTFGRSFLDPVAEVGFLAGATERIGLGTSVLLTPYRNPVLLANAAASLDALSGGRFRLGMGIGWSEAEFAALGVPFGQRGARTDEAIDVMRALWTGQPVTFRGRWTTLDGAVLGTPTATAGGPPLVIGGRSDAALARAIRHGAQWQGYQHFPETLAEVRNKLEQLEGGRDVVLSDVCDVAPPHLAHLVEGSNRQLGGAGADTAAIVEELAAMAAAGAALTVLRFPLPTACQIEAMEWAARELLPAAAGLPG